MAAGEQEGEDPFGGLRVLEGVEETGRRLGVGAFGEVIESWENVRRDVAGQINYGPTRYAAKKMHDNLVDRNMMHVDYVRRNYARECRILSGLRHCNVTEFIGLYYQPGHGDLPLLVMELLRISVHELLETEPDVPLQMKLSFLHDVSTGLHYLHSQEVLHRDLTAKNVLLAEDLRVAKISDMGTSRMVRLPPGAKATFTSVPGTAVYMPPEATDTSAKTRYGYSLDIFSFGVLALFTFTQVFPEEVLPPTYEDEDEEWQVRSEVERRQRYFNILTQGYGAHREIIDLVTKCLNKSLKKRPPSEDLEEEVRCIKENFVQENLTVDVMTDLNVRALVAGLEARQMQTRVHEFEKSNDKSEMDNKELMRKLEEKDDELQKMKAEMEKTVNIEKEKLKECEKKLYEKELELKNIKSASSQSPLQGPLNVDWPHGPDWQHGPDMLFGVSDYVQSIALQDGLYVGGGWCRKRSDNNFIIIKYDFQSKLWVQLKVAYTARDFAMVAVTGHLVLVGGCDRSNCDTNLLGMWSSEDNEWQCPYPPMPTARHNASAVCFKNDLIVAGGLNQGPVEILDLDTNQWACVPGLAPWHSMKSALVGDTWCLMGGYRKLKPTSELFAISLPALVSLATATTGSDQTSSFECKEFCGTGSNFSTPVNIGGYLFIVGGKRHGTTEDTIKCFMSPGKWQDVGKLPCPLFNCACTCYDGLIFVAAGTIGQKCSKLFVGSIPSL